ISPDAIERAGLGNQASRPVQVVGVTGTSTASLVTIPLLDVAGARIGPIVAAPPTPPPMFRAPGPAPDRGALDRLLGPLALLLLQRGLGRGPRRAHASVSARHPATPRALAGAALSAKP